MSQVWEIHDAIRMDLEIRSPYCFRQERRADTIRAKEVGWVPLISFLDITSQKHLRTTLFGSTIAYSW